MKLYKIWTNDGNWNGSFSDFIIANSEKEAIEKSNFHKRRIEDGCDYFVKEVNGQALAEAILTSEDAKKYIFDFMIKEIEAD